MVALSEMYLLAMAVVALQPAAAEPVAYLVSYPMAGAERVSVRVELPDRTPGPRVLVMPRAIPMGYGEQPYDRFVSSVSASSSEGTPLEVVAGQGPRWRLGDADSTVARIEYDVDVALMEREVLAASDSSKVRSGYLSLLGYSVFGYVEGLGPRDVRLSIEVPEDWPVLTTLRPRAPSPTGRTTAAASDFYALADSQIVAGPDLVVRRLEGDVPLFLAMYSEGTTDPAFMGQLVEEVMEKVIAYFDGAPFAHYTVHQELLRPLSDRHGYGFSMEHLDSATFYLAAARGLTASSSPDKIARTRYNFAHHFAHAWIPKRASGKGYYPFSWELAPVLDTIWFSEGFGQYAALDALADGLPEDASREYRDGLISRRFRSSLDDAPLFIKRMSLVELSRVASTRYSEDFRTGRNVFSRGALMAAEMDEVIRDRSGGSKRLRDALRHLMSWSEEHKRPFRIEELPEIFEAATGVDTRDVLERWLQPLAR